MFRAEIESEIQKLKKQLQDCRAKKKKAESEQRELNTIISKIQRKIEEIEDGLQETLRTIEKRLENVNPKSKFKVKYLEKAKGFLLNSSSSSALENTRNAERNAKKKYLELEDTISSCNMKIQSLEQEIEKLNNQLKQMGV